MKCPICQRPVKLSDPEAPFCSARCRDVDLGNWATEKYIISSPIQSSSAMRDPADEIDED
jgi:endogenous inhibitor of DNA gyrase (YacG/DUF329 family)